MNSKEDNAISGNEVLSKVEEAMYPELPLATALDKQFSKAKAVSAKYESFVNNRQHMGMVSRALLVAVIEAMREEIETTNTKTQTKLDHLDNLLKKLV